MDAPYVVGEPQHVKTPGLQKLEAAEARISARRVFTEHLSFQSDKLRGTREGFSLCT